MTERVLDNLNAALHRMMAADERVLFLGEDVLDPYGGAFKVSLGLSTKFPDRVFTTPISESGIVGVANGLALAGQRPIVEFMFGDFIFLAFDQIVNFAAKSVSMYGERMPFHLLLRCPVGGHRGYGATHSQSVQKHFLGVPDLTLCELSPLHDCREMLPRLMEAGSPAILFENKTLYAHPRYTDSVVDDLFNFQLLGEGGNFAVATVDQAPPVVIITAGGSFPFCLKAARELLLEHEIECALVTPFQLYPFASAPLEPLLAGAKRIYVVEEGGAGGTWGAEVAATVAVDLPGVRAPIRLIHSSDSIIPSARHLERKVLISSEMIVNRVAEDEQ